LTGRAAPPGLLTRVCKIVNGAGATVLLVNGAGAAVLLVNGAGAAVLLEIVLR